MDLNALKGGNHDDERRGMGAPVSYSDIRSR